MSSSRSIAAARNRRANDSSMTKQQAPPPRPGTSIGANGAFNQQMQGQPRKYVNVQPPQQQFEAQPPPPPAKISVSDAIGLTTLRLGRLEQTIQRLEQTGFSGTSIPENSQVVDQSVLHTLITRIDGLEKRDQAMNHLGSEIQLLKNEIFSIRKQIGDLNNRLQSNMFEVNNRFTEIDQAFVELENSKSQVPDEGTSQVEQQPDTSNQDNTSPDEQPPSDSVDPART